MTAHSINKIKTKLLLATSPIVDPTMPPSSIATLYAFLKQQGCTNVETADWNIEFIDWILNSKRLLAYYKKMLSWLKEMENKEIPKNELDKFRNWYDLFNEKQYLEQIKHVNKAKKIIRSKDFYNIKKYIPAIECIGFIFKFIEKISFPYITNPFMYYSLRERINTQTELINAVSGYCSQELKPIHDFAKEIVLKRIEREKPDCIGFSLPCSSQLFPATIISKIIKDNCKCKILFGGASISQLVENVVDGHVKMESGSLIPFVDDIIYGDAEIPLFDYMKTISSNKQLTDDILNLVQINGTFKPNKNNIWQADDLNQFPTPDYSKHPLHLYLSPKPVLSVPATRGCYWSKCVFCRESYRGFGNINASARYIERGIGAVIDDIKELKSKHRINSIMLSVCSTTSKYLLKLSDELIRQKLNIKYALDLRIDKDYLDKENAQKLYKGGLIIAAIGFESASNKVLKLMKKGTNSSQISSCFKTLSKAGIIIKPLWFCGFPDESNKDLDKTINFLIKHKKNISVSNNIYPLVIPIGSEMFSNSEKYNIETSNDSGLFDPLVSFKYMNRAMMDFPKMRRNAVQKLSKHFPSFSGYILFSNFLAHALLFTSKNGSKTISRIENIIFNKNKIKAIRIKNIKNNIGFLKLKKHTYISTISTENNGSKVDGKIVFSDSNMHSAMNKNGIELLKWFRTKRSISLTKTYFKKNKISLGILDNLLAGNFIEYCK